MRLWLCEIHTKYHFSSTLDKVEIRRPHSGLNEATAKIGCLMDGLSTEMWARKMDTTINLTRAFFVSDC